MKLLRITFQLMFFLTIGLGFVACSEDEDTPDAIDDTPASICQADWLGSYDGTCDGFPVTLTVVASSSSTDTRYSLTLLDLELTGRSGTLVYSEDCTTATDADAGVTLTKIDENTISVTTTDGASNPLEGCGNSITLTK